MKDMRLSIAVVQFKINYAFPNDNLERMSAYIAEAKEGRADLIIFPEESVLFGMPNEEARNSDVEYLEYFKSEAKRYAIDIVPGSWLVRDGSRVFNKARYIDREGNVLGAYDKRNLWRSEAQFTSPGSEILPFSTRFGIIGLALCWDIMDPTIFREQAKQGAEVFLVPSHWVNDADGLSYSPDDVSGIDAMCLARAYENNAIVVFCNAGGALDGTGRALVGRSQIVAPIKGTIINTDNTNEGMFIQEVDTEVIRKAERLNGLRLNTLG